MLDFLLGNDFLSALVAFALVLIPAIIIHELGHFLAAKAVGITVLEFGIGFPPRIARLFRWGETEFTLNWLPLGGFVRPLGEDMIRPLSEEAVERDRKALESKLTDGNLTTERDELLARGITKTMSVNEAKPLPRIFFMAAGALANFLSAFVLFVVIGLIGAPEVVGGRVEVLEIPSTSSLARAGVESRDWIEAVNGEKFANSEEYFSRLSQLQGQEVTLTIRKATTGEAIDVQFVPSEDIAVRKSYVRILGIAADSPAALGGLEPDDLIIGFNGQSITTSDDPTGMLQQLTDSYAGTEITLNVLRENAELEVKLTPRVNPPPDEGKMGVSIWPEFRNEAFGFTYTEGPSQEELVPQSLGDSVQFGFERTAAVLAMIAEVPSRIIRGTMTAEEARPVSIIGISQWGSQVLQQSIQESQPINFLNYIAIISILLGLTNLLPLPALDGGRIMFVLLEIVRGRPISPEREGMVHLIGLMFILSIGVLFMLNDIINPLPTIVP
jgi:regulator of sigma E protease